MERFSWISRGWTPLVVGCHVGKRWMVRVLASLAVGWNYGKWCIRRVLTFIHAGMGRSVQIIVVAVILTVAWLTLQYWDWLSNDSWEWLGATPRGEDRQETNSTTLRNVGLVVAGMIALPLALWRSWIAGRQANAALSQAEMAQQGLLNDRYQKGTELLSNDVLSVRLGGIYALQRLAEEHPIQYHIPIMELFCAFVRNPTKEDDSEGIKDAEVEQAQTTPSLREDVRTIMEVIGDRRETSIALEREASFRLDLRQANLQQMILWDCDLSGAIFTGANLSGARLFRAKLSGSILEGVNLSSASLGNVDLSGASLTGVANLSRMTIGGFLNVSGAEFTELDLSGVRLMGMKNLTQEQLDQAHADRLNPPLLGGLVDPKTGEGLVWRGEAFDDET